MEKVDMKSGYRSGYRNKRKKSKTLVMNIGTSSMLVILTGLCFAVLAALAISSARNDYRLSQELAEHTAAYYAACGRAQELLAEPEKLHQMYQSRDESGCAEFTVSVNERQELAVELCFEDGAEMYRITKWKIENTGGWEGDTSLPVLQAPEH